MALCLKVFHHGSGMAIASDENHKQKAFVGFVWTLRTWVTLFLRSWVCAMVRTIVVMALSTGVTARLFLARLDRLEV